MNTTRLRVSRETPLAKFTRYKIYVNDDRFPRTEVTFDTSFNHTVQRYPESPITNIDLTAQIHAADIDFVQQTIDALNLAIDIARYGPTYPEGDIPPTSPSRSTATP